MQKGVEEMDSCKKCGGNDMHVVFEPEGKEQTYNRGIDGVEKFMRNDTYYYYDKVKTEHLIFTCKRCGYKAAENCKDKQ